MKILWIVRYTDITYFVVDDKIVNSIYDDQIDGEVLEVFEMVAQALGATIRHTCIDDLITSRLGHEPDGEVNEIAKWLEQETAETLFGPYENN